MLVSDISVASSSGVTNSDAALLGDRTIQKLINNVETLLEERNYSVANALCAGRLEIENITSKIKHSKVRYSI